MLIEIVTLRVLCGKLGNKLRAKNRKPLNQQILLVVVWFGAEITGIVLGQALAAILNPGDENLRGLCLVGFAYGFAITAAVVFFKIANQLPALVLFADEDDVYHAEIAEKWDGGRRRRQEEPEEVEPADDNGVTEQPPALPSRDVDNPIPE